MITNSHESSLIVALGHAFLTHRVAMKVHLEKVSPAQSASLMIGLVFLTTFGITRVTKIGKCCDAMNVAFQHAAERIARLVKVANT